jgi:hypothetical protein
MFKFFFLIMTAIFLTALASAQDSSFLSRPSPFAGSTLLSLATFEEVRKEIGLTPADEAHVDQLVDKFTVEIGQSFKKTEDDFEAGQNDLDRLSNTYDDKLMLVLSASETARLRQLYIQYVGVLAVNRPDIAQLLGVTDDQKAQLTELQTVEHHKFKALLEQSLPMQEAQDQMRQNREDYKGALSKVLSKDQRETLKSLAGAHFEFQKIES